MAAEAPETRPVPEPATDMTGAVLSELHTETHGMVNSEAGAHSTASCSGPRLMLGHTMERQSALSEWQHPFHQVTENVMKEPLQVTTTCSKHRG